jgi:hypothetical protein
VLLLPRTMVSLLLSGGGCLTLVSEGIVTEEVFKGDIAHFRILLIDSMDHHGPVLKAQLSHRNA